MKSICIDSRDNYERIYAGSFEEFGYFESDETNQLIYHSLSQNVEDHQFHNDEIWSIYPFDGKFYFQTLRALKHFYFDRSDKIWGKYGFYDAFNVQDDWYPQRYLAIDQLTITPMIENYRTGLLWNLFMGAPEIREGLKKLGFTYEE